MSEAEAAVYLIDDDESVRRALARQLRTAGFSVETYASAQAFLDHVPGSTGIACIISDLRMPGLTGLDLQSSLAVAGRDWPMVFISGHADVPASVQAMRRGAIHFLPKPFTEAEILGAVREALGIATLRASARRAADAVAAKYNMLTPRERDVFGLVVAGSLNKVVADRLGIAEKTVKIHRARVMEKMQAQSVTDLVRMAAHLPAPD